MSRLMYYVPGAARSVTDTLIRDVGITGGIEGMQHKARGVEANGPDGGAGLLFASYSGEFGMDVGKFGYYPKEQTWECCNEGKFWIGYETAEKPGPEELQRAEIYKGYPVVFADGRSWMVPTVYPMAGGHVLPYVMKFNAQRQVEEIPLPEYEPVMAGVSEYRAWAWGESGTSFRHVRAAEIAALVLGLNYTVGFWEANLLGLFDSQNVFKACEAAIDIPEYEKAIAEFQASEKKKTESMTGANRSDLPGPDTGCGETGVTPEEGCGTAI